MVKFILPNVNNSCRAEITITWPEAVDAVCTIAEQAVHFGSDFTEEDLVRLENTVGLIRSAWKRHADHVKRYPERHKG